MPANISVVALDAGIDQYKEVGAARAVHRARPGLALPSPDGESANRGCSVRQAESGPPACM
jgi:hypothetical protein